MPVSRKEFLDIGFTLKRVRDIIRRYRQVDNPLILKEKEIFNKLANEKVNTGNLIYRYKGKTPNEKFNKYDNALDIIDKIRDGTKTILYAKNEQTEFKSKLGEIKKGNDKKNQKAKKTHYTILKCFTKQGTVLLNFVITILQCSLKQNIKQKMNQLKNRKQQGLKY